MEPLETSDPKVIGGYKLVGRLGSGGMGIVYLASGNAQNVAIKVIRDTLARRSEDRKRFAREIESLTEINSPNVAKIIDSGEDQGLPWFATEFVNGPNIHELVKQKGPLNERDWWQLARGLIGGLASIHSRKIVHRDIKPSNIIWTENGPKIIDFGIAHFSDATSVTSTGMVAGSPAWFSPEQLEGLALTEATDIFSAGSVLTYAATGQSPWGDETTLTRASVFRILTSKPDLGKASEAQKQLLNLMLEKNPRRRSSAILLFDQLESPESEGSQRRSVNRKSLKILGSVLGFSGVLALLFIGLSQVTLDPERGNPGALTLTTASQTPQEFVSVLPSDFRFLGKAEDGVIDYNPSAKLKAMSAPYLLGRPYVGESLVAMPPTFEATQVRIAYQWYVGGLQLSKETSNTLTLKESMVGEEVSVTITGIKFGFQPHVSRLVFANVIFDPSRSVVPTATPSVIATESPGLPSEELRRFVEAPTILLWFDTNSTAGYHFYSTGYCGGNVYRRQEGRWSPGYDYLVARWFVDGEHDSKDGNSEWSYSPPASDVSRVVYLELTAGKQGFEDYTIVSESIQLPACQICFNDGSGCVSGLDFFGYRVKRAALY